MSEWNGDNRRQSSDNYCSQHIDLMGDIGIIKEKISEINKKLDKSFHVWLTLIILALGLVTQVIYFSAANGKMDGRLTNQAEVNSKRITFLENVAWAEKSESRVKIK
jgi:hypothetical protein